MQTDILLREGIYVLRVLLAVLCGALIGLERERRQKTAGIRTHILVALTAAVMVIVSKYGFFDVIGIDGISIDAGRIAAATVSAVGFIGTGVIFVRRDSAMGLTTAAGLWATVGVGIAIGAGMYFLGLTATVIVLIMQSVLHLSRFKIMLHMGGEVKVNLTQQRLSPAQVRSRLDDMGIACRSVKMKRTAEGIWLTAQLYLPPDAEERKLADQLTEAEWIEELSLYSIS